MSDPVDELSSQAPVRAGRGSPTPGVRGPEAAASSAASLVVRMRLTRAIRPNLRSTAARLLVCAASCAIAGCVSVRPIEPDAQFALRPDEGILVVHVRTNTPVLLLEFGWAPAASDLSEGEHLLLLAVDAGAHSWSQVTVDAATFSVVERRTASGEATLTYQQSARGSGRLEFRGEKMGFRVEAGRVNYPGMLLLDRTAVYEMDAQLIDRTASALAQLEERFPELLARYPVVYTGQARHVFLDHYLTGRDGVGGPSSDVNP